MRALVIPFHIEVLCHLEADHPVLGSLSGWAMSLEQPNARDISDEEFNLLRPIASIFFSNN